MTYDFGWMSVVEAGEWVWKPRSSSRHISTETQRASQDRNLRHENRSIFKTLSLLCCGPVVAMMQTSESRARSDTTRRCCASSASWCSLPKPEMGAVLVIVADIFRKEPFQMTFVHCDDVV